MNLHPACETRLRAVLANILSTATVSDSLYLDWKSIKGLIKADEVLPKNERELLRSWIGTEALFNFCFDWFHNASAKMKDNATSKASALLTEIPGFDNTEEVAERIVDSLRSLPWKYSLIIPLPMKIGGPFARVRLNYDISQHIHLVTPDEEFSKQFPAPPSRRPEQALSFTGTSLANLLSTPISVSEPTWDRNNSYIQIYIDGFIDSFQETPSATTAVEHLKEIFGVGQALQLFHKEFNPAGREDGARFSVYRCLDGKWIFQRWLALDDSVSQLFLDMVPTDLSEDDVSDTELPLTITNKLQSLGAIYRDVKAARLLLAGHWLFDCDTGSDQLLSFVRATVAMEIMLSEKAESEKVGITELIKNRCAYLLAKTVEEREMIMRDFPLIYNVRSRIVHEGKKRLSSEERELLFRLRWLCDRVVWKESQLFAADQGCGTR